jgi:hypothetical protein
MRSEIHSFLVPPAAQTPHIVIAAERWISAGWAAARKGLLTASLMLWRGLEAQGQRRAQRSLLAAAVQCERTAPERALDLRRAAASLACPARTAASTPVCLGAQTASPASSTESARSAGQGARS